MENINQLKNKKKMDVSKIKKDSNVVAHVVKNFVDFKGDTHKITIVAYNMFALTERKYGNKNLIGIGVSIQHPKDEFIEILGIQRAVKNLLKKFSNNEFVPVIAGNFNFSSKFINDVLENEYNHIVENINAYIKGYSDAKKKFDAKRAKKDAELIAEV